jgi:hypothetical protein
MLNASLPTAGYLTKPPRAPWSADCFFKYGLDSALFANNKQIGPTTGASIQNINGNGNDPSDPLYVNLTYTFSPITYWNTYDPTKKKNVPIYRPVNPFSGLTTCVPTDA